MSLRTTFSKQKVIKIISSVKKNNFKTTDLAILKVLVHTLQGKGNKGL